MRLRTLAMVWLLPIGVGQVSLAVATPPAGSIVTVVGSYTGDRGPALQARLVTPSSLASDGKVLYIADESDNRIRRITGGVIDTYVGDGTDRLSDGSLDYSRHGALPHPSSVAADLTTHDLYVGRAESVWKVTSAGRVTNVLQFAGVVQDPRGMVVGPAGVYVADSEHNRVLLLDRSGVLSVVAGTGVAGFSGDGQGATTAELSRPTALALDPQQNLYIADDGNNRVRVVSRGTIRTFAGNGGHDISGPGGAATSTSIGRPTALSWFRGQVIIGLGDGNLALVVSAGRALRLLSFPTGGFAPAALVSFGKTLVASSGEGRLYSLDPSGRLAPRVFAGAALLPRVGMTPRSVALRQGYGLAVSPSGLVAVSDPQRHLVVVLDLSHDRVVNVIGNGRAGWSKDGTAIDKALLHTPTSLAYDPDGRLYVADPATHRVSVIAEGTIRTVAGPTGPGRTLMSPAGLAFDARGLLISDIANARLYRLVAGHLVIVAGEGGPATTASLDSPRAVTVNKLGILIADTDTANNIQRLRLLTADNRLQTVQIVSPDLAALGRVSLAQPGGLFGTSASTIFHVSDSNAVWRGDLMQTSAGIVTQLTRVAGTGTHGFSGDGGAATSADLAFPGGIGFRGSCLLVADIGNARLRMVC